MQTPRKERVLLTGASGSMGYEAFRELWRRRRQYEIVLLLRPSEKNKKMFAPWERRAGATSISGRGRVESPDRTLTIFWGDATRYDDVLAAMEGVDCVLSPMALIPPEADHNPDAAAAVNVTATRYLIDAIRAQPGGADHIRFIYIGSVAQYGDRLPPIHYGRVGDPLLPSPFDFYATTKTAGERLVIESGLRYWASLRQTYIAIPESLTKVDPIMFHQPFGTHIEMNTARDAGYGLVQCLEVPEASDFWRNIYNMAGGPGCRLVFLPYVEKMFELLGFGNVYDIWEPRWFALRNFHCCWYDDSDVLEGYLHHWRDDLEAHYRQVEEASPAIVRLAGHPAVNRLIPNGLIKAFMHMEALKPNAPLYWMRHNLELRIRAFFGSRERWEQIGDWSTVHVELDPAAKRLEHGYDPDAEIDLKQLKEAARFRGGRLVSRSFDGDLHKPLLWESYSGERFELSPQAVLRGGHWAPSETAPPWNYDDIAQHNPFVAQAWWAHHDRRERNFYPADCYRDIVG